MSSFSFIDPALLWGLGLASIPIIIHLLFRRRYRRIDWAPMYYLKLSIQRNRRRVRLEQLLLLALRTLLLLLLFFLLARPFVQAQGFGKWLGGQSRTSQIVLLDDSLSMAYREGGRSAWDRAQEFAAKVLETVGPKDRFTLVLASRPKRPLLREVELKNPDDALQLIRDERPSDAFVSWEPVVQAMDELIISGSYPVRELTVITDLRRAGWDDTIRAIGDRWSSQRVRLRIFDVGSQNTANVSLEDLKQLDRLAMVGAPTNFEAVIHNAGDGDISALDATWTVDGKPTVVKVPAIERGQTATVPLTALFQEPGLHHVELELPSDDLPADNHRWIVCRAVEQVHILLVDGEPSSEPLAGEVDFLGLALALGAGDSDAFRVQVVTDSEWDTLPAGQPDLIVLANVGGLTREQAQTLERQVAAGAGLMIFPGDQIDPTNYAQLLYRDGEGPLPAAPEANVDEEFSGLVLESGPPGPLDALAALSPAVLERIKIRRFLQVTSPEEEHPDVRILARWNNSESSPAVLEKTFGQGRVVLWTVTADRRWSDWPTEPSYVLAMRETASAIARGDGGSRLLTAGDELRKKLPEAEQVDAPAPMVESPGHDKPQPLRVEEAGAAADASPAGTDGKKPSAANVGHTPQELTYDDTRHAGLYRLSWNIVAAGAREDLIAVNPDRRESQLARIEDDQLRGYWGGLEAEVIHAVSAEDTPIAVRPQEIWQVLAMSLLGLLVAESCLATWTGRQR